ncbi:MAG: hypothetical protein COA79_04960 [Planctomycetota bacterium]|nr:MAG: hypothetical protein COA79_04960 [Planctomycetota bacterium]
MLSEIQFKGLYLGRLAYVETDDVVATQLFGVVCISFKKELFAEHRVKFISMFESAKKNGSIFAFILQFPSDIEFSSVDLNVFKELFIMTLEWRTHFSIVGGNLAIESVKKYSRTQSIPTFLHVSDALKSVADKYLEKYESKMTRNIFVMESDNQMRESLLLAFLKDRFSTIDANSYEEGLAVSKRFGHILDGAIVELIYPEFKEVEIIEYLKNINPDMKILIHTAVLDPQIINICKEFNITGVVKSPYQISNLLKKYKHAFPERHENYMGFKQ